MEYLVIYLITIAGSLVIDKISDVVLANIAIENVKRNVLKQDAYKKSNKTSINDVLLLMKNKWRKPNIITFTPFINLVGSFLEGLTNLESSRVNDFINQNYEEIELRIHKNNPNNNIIDETKKEEYTANLENLKERNVFGENVFVRYLCDGEIHTIKFRINDDLNCLITELSGKTFEHQSEHYDNLLLARILVELAQGNSIGMYYYSDNLEKYLVKIKEKLDSGRDYTFKNVTRERNIG